MVRFVLLGLHMMVLMLSESLFIACVILEWKYAQQIFPSCVLGSRGTRKPCSFLLHPFPL